MNSTLDETLQQALACHRAGRVQEAESLYRAILKLQPAHSPANYHLGILTMDVHQPQVARELFETALAADPAVLQYRVTLADYLYACGDWERAQQLADEADSLQLRSPALDELRQKMNGHSSGKKVFCIGCNKTGTTSLGVALKSLGLRLGNQPRGEMLLEDWARGDFTKIIALCRTADAFQDVPFSLDRTYQALDANFPCAKFILTLRDNPEQWYQSLVRYHSNGISEGRLPTAEELAVFPYRYRGFIWRTLQLAFGASEGKPYDREGYIAHYSQHNREVVEYFSGRPDSLLVINIGEPHAMRRICEFVEIPWSGQDMPHHNRSN